jgi:hypothetical protein
MCPAAAATSAATTHVQTTFAKDYDPRRSWSRRELWPSRAQEQRVRCSGATLLHSSLARSRRNKIVDLPATCERLPRQTIPCALRRAHAGSNNNYYCTRLAATSSSRFDSCFFFGGMFDLAPSLERRLPGWRGGGLHVQKLKLVVDPQPHHHQTRAPANNNNTRSSVIADDEPTWPALVAYCIAAVLVAVAARCSSPALCTKQQRARL